MSEVILRYADRLRQVQANIEEMIKEVIEENATLIEDMIISQLQKGERGDGLILPNYSPVSVFVYGKPPGPIKLFDTGSFYRKIEVKPFDNAFAIEDTDYKTDKIIGRFGEEVLLINQEHKQELIDKILTPGLIEKSHKMLTQ